MKNASIEINVEKEILNVEMRLFCLKTLSHTVVTQRYTHLAYRVDYTNRPPDAISFMLAVGPCSSRFLYSQ